MRTESEQKRIFLDEISVLIIENSAVSITGCLIADLINRKIKTVFCDHRCDPIGELMPYYGCHDCSGKLRNQIQWDSEYKSKIWTSIVREKIYQQALFLSELGKDEEAAMLMNYLDEVVCNDISNREGHAAKVYFNALFGKQFSRSRDRFSLKIPYNFLINPPGYGIIISTTY